MPTNKKKLRTGLRTPRDAVNLGPAGCSDNQLFPASSHHNETGTSL